MVTDDRLIAHDHRAGRHRIETGDILGQLQGHDGISIFICTGSDANVVVLGGIRRIHQVGSLGPTFDGHFLVQFRVNGIPIISGKLQTIFQGSDGMGMLCIAEICDAGHVGLQGSLRIIRGILIACADGNRLDRTIVARSVDNQGTCLSGFIRTGAGLPQRHGMGIEVTVQLNGQGTRIFISQDLHIGAAIIVAAIRAGSLNGQGFAQISMNRDSPIIALEVQAFVRQSLVHTIADSLQVANGCCILQHGAACSDGGNIYRLVLVCVIKAALYIGNLLAAVPLDRPSVVSFT